MGFMLLVGLDWSKSRKDHSSRSFRSRVLKNNRTQCFFSQSFNISVHESHPSQRPISLRLYNDMTIMNIRSLSNSLQHVVIYTNLHTSLRIYFQNIYKYLIYILNICKYLIYTQVYNNQYTIINTQ